MKHHDFNPQAHKHKAAVPAQGGGRRPRREWRETPRLTCEGEVAERAVSQGVCGGGGGREGGRSGSLEGLSRRRHV